MATNAPAALTDVAALVDRRIEQLFDEQRDVWHRFDPRLAEAVDQLAGVLTSGGKRLRAAFCYWAWFGSGVGSGSGSGNGRVGGNSSNGASGPFTDGFAAGHDDPTGVIDVAAAIELLHAFALIHDDVMDDSATRRGRPTVHIAQANRLVDQGWRGEPRRFGEGVAILVGDLSHAYADLLLAGAHPAARRIWDGLKIELNLGQYLDLRSAAAGQLDAETAERVSTFKSALYTIVRPLQLGASLDGPADPDLLDLLDRFGRPLGRAFQLKDDLLGVLGNETEVGKPVGDDLREGKPTELVAVAVSRASAPEQELLAGIGRRDLAGDEVAAIVEVFHATGAVEEVTGRIAVLVDEAVSVLPRLPLRPEALDALHALAGYVATRTS